MTPLDLARRHLVGFLVVASAGTLSIMVLARLAGTYPGTLSYGRAILEWLLFVAFLNAVVLANATAVMAAQNTGFRASMSYAIDVLAYSLLYAGAILLAARLYGALDDLDAFVRAVVAPVGWILVSGLTVGAYLLDRSLHHRPPTAPTRSHGHTAGLMAWLVGLIATAIAMYVIDSFWPWRNMRLTQFAIIASGLIGPAFIAALLLLGTDGKRRRLFATLLLALTSFAALL